MRSKDSVTPKSVSTHSGLSSRQDEQDFPCEFCSELSINEKNSSHGLFPSIRTRILFRTSRFVVFSALGAFVPGYLLIVPLKHYLSIAQLPDCDILELESVKRETARVISSHYAPPIFFEHGAVEESNRGGCCITHAHLQVAPVSIDLIEPLGNFLSGQEVESIVEARRWINSGTAYIYYEEPSGRKFIYSAPRDLPSQFMRRLICAALGKTDEWDWAVFVGKDNIMRTLSDLSGWRADSQEPSTPEWNRDLPGNKNDLIYQDDEQS